MWYLGSTYRLKGMILGSGIFLVEKKNLLEISLIYIRFIAFIQIDITLPDTAKRFLLVYKLKSRHGLIYHI